MYNQKLGYIIASLLLLIPSGAGTPFNPRDYPKKTATCKAAKRMPRVETVDIRLSYVDINPTATNSILMVHGWPGLWSTWSNQIQEFEGDHHLIIPDLRGFGESTHPGDVRSSGTMGDLVGDLVCVLQDAGVTSAICMGHDWGCQLCYEAARMRPDIFTAVVGGVIPYMPSDGEFTPMKQLALEFPTLSYQIYFDTQTDVAVSELDRDIRRSIRATLRTVDSPPPDEYLKSKTSFLAAWGDAKEIPAVPFFTQDEEDYLIEQYSIQGFKHTLQFYISELRRASWEFAHTQGNYSVPQPVLAIYPRNDPVADWEAASRLLRSQEFTPNLTVEVLDGAHWVHLEHPSKFNAVVRKWLDKLEQNLGSIESEPRAIDEL